MAVTLLAADGALSLDDPVQRHLGFVPEFEYPVTVRQMIYHIERDSGTSGSSSPCPDGASTT